jgi:hypothetical protein
MSSKFFSELCEQSYESFELVTPPIFCLYENGGGVKKPNFVMRDRI